MRFLKTSAAILHVMLDVHFMTETSPILTWGEADGQLRPLNHRLQVIPRSPPSPDADSQSHYLFERRENRIHVIPSTMTPNHQGGCSMEVDLLGDERALAIDTRRSPSFLLPEFLPAWGRGIGASGSFALSGLVTTASSEGMMCLPRRFA